MDDYLCLTVRSAAGESEAAFKARLSAFWTHMLRNHKVVFDKVYAETSSFATSNDRLSRRYLVEAEAADAVARQLRSLDLEHEPIDPDDVYSKYEAAPPEWFWIEH
jgi:hypothetical protein